jgi:hypothetical protein
LGQHRVRYRLLTKPDAPVPRLFFGLDEEQRRRCGREFALVRNVGRFSAS